MKDITALEAKYKELGAEIEALKSAKVKEWPQVGNVYFYISGNGMAQSSTWDNDSTDSGREAVGNIFRTMAEATKELETRKTIAELRAQPGRKRFLEDIRNFCIKVLPIRGTCTTEYFTETDCGFASTYFESEQAARNAIKAVGADRILSASKWISMGE